MTNVLRPLPVDEFVRLADHSDLEVNREDLENLARRRLLQPYESGSYSRLHLYILAVYFDAIRVYRHPWSMRSSGRSLDEVKTLAESVQRVAVDLEDEEFVAGLGGEVAQLALDIERFIATVDPFGPIADVIDVVRSDVREKLRGSGRLYAELRATASALAARSEELEALEARGPQTREVPEDVLKETAEKYPLGDLSDLTDGFEDDEGFEALEVRGPLTREIHLAAGDDDDDELEEPSEPEAIELELELDSEADETGEMDVAAEDEQVDEADGDVEVEELSEASEPDEDADAEESEPEELEVEEPEESEPEELELDEAEESEAEEAEAEESDAEDAEESDAEEAEESDAEEDVEESEAEEEEEAEESEAEEAEESEIEDSDVEEADESEDEEADEPDGAEPEADESEGDESEGDESEGEESEGEEVSIYGDSSAWGESDAEESDSESSGADDEEDGEDAVDEDDAVDEEDEEDEDDDDVDHEESDVFEVDDSDVEDDEDDDLEDDFVADDTSLMESDPSEEDLRTTLETEAASDKANDNPFTREDSMSRTGRTKALLDRLEEIKAQKDEPADGSPVDASLEEKVNELNQKREQLIRAQDWAGLVTLYETRIDLFEEPGDRQQVFLTLATLYELKLSDHKSAFEAFSAAFDIDVRAGKIKTLDSLRKIGRGSDVVQQYLSWLEGHLTVADDEEMRHVMQRDLSDAHRAAGHPQRGFLAYAAYIAEDPERATPEALDFMDEMSISVGDDELAAFYDDILEHEASPETQTLIGHRAGMFFQSCNRPADAIRAFRTAFDADPSSELAYSNLSRLYEKHERWGEFRSLIAEKLKTAEGDEAARLRKELGRIVANETSTADAVDQFAATLEDDPNDDSALERLMSGYSAQNRFSDAYAHLNRLLDKNPDPPQQVRIRRHLAELAMNHLESPEEASHHLETALDLIGPQREILELLASVRLSAGEWSEAISTVRMLTDGAVSLPRASRRKWLNAGIEAARMAERPDDMRHFQEHLQRESGSA